MEERSELAAEPAMTLVAPHSLEVEHTRRRTFARPSSLQIIEHSSARHDPDAPEDLCDAIDGAWRLEVERMEGVEEQEQEQCTGRLGGDGGRGV
jgi:hypothetical protein